MLGKYKFKISLFVSISRIYSIPRWIKCALSDWSWFLQLFGFPISTIVPNKPFKSSWAKNTIEQSWASYLEGIALILRRYETIDFIRCEVTQMGLSAMYIKRNVQNELWAESYLGILWDTLGVWKVHLRLKHLHPFTIYPPIVTLWTLSLRFIFRLQCWFEFLVFDFCLLQTEVAHAELFRP